MAAHRMHNEYLKVLYDAELQNLIKRRGVDALLLATCAEGDLPHLCIQKGDEYTNALVSIIVSRS